jgi:uncharacterized protein (DUF1778 family)
MPKLNNEMQCKAGVDVGADAVGRNLDTLLDQRLFELDPDKYDAFARMLDNPPLAGPALKALMKRRPTWQK